ncbi:hypothetical protein AUC68_12930 [Methyloceanibacter methanicus]|uniref:BioF2-like acetyltransferase domain-containing protein n=1 Tax=Methyloceanibacter methanicus TaxID=1774968 RepID=A0A1E3W4W2_9HYPH|nr:GNAT family N-acetyltransferase [Methyloceanibacter methanicus]ODS00849.1 hypothetical protein AUC68_12930 [Methyloceanibacter methanicus]
MEASELAQPVLQTSAGPIALQVTSDLKAVRSLWHEMQDAVACTCAQTFDWARAWSEHVLAAEDRTPAIVVGHAADGSAAFLLPFETKRIGGLTVLKWLGQDHANYVFGLFRPEVAGVLTDTDMSAILHEIGRRTGAAAAFLEAQPFTWDGVPNPFALLSHQPAPNSGYAVKLGNFEDLYLSRFKKRARQTLLRKERRLQEAGTLTYGWAATEQEKTDILETFFAQKAQQFAAMGVTDVFVPEARAFYRDLAMLPDGNASRLRLGYVSLDGEILATFSGTITHGRVCVLLSSLADSPYQRQSPGAQLLRYQIEDACNEGLRYFDLGVGAARHKSEWSNIVYPLFDSYIALKPQGLALTLPFGVKSSVKRRIKSNPRLWALAQALRKWVNARRV